MQDISKALAFLKARGYKVAESFLSPEGKMHVWVADRACASEHVQMLVELENLKSSATAIDSSALTALAGLCRQVSESGAVDSATAAKARNLQTDWRILVQRGTPPPQTLKEKQALDAEGGQLAGRMVNFLARELPNLSVLTRTHVG